MGVNALGLRRPPLSMETVAVITDIHANLPSLQAALARIEELGIARDLEDCACAYITPQERELGRRSVDWTLEHTSRSAKDLLRALPFDLRFMVGDSEVHLVHGSPRKVNEYLFEDNPTGSTSAWPPPRRRGRS